MEEGSLVVGRVGAASPRKVNSSTGRVPQWGHGMSMSVDPSVQVRCGALALFVDHVAGLEPVETIGGVELVGFVLGDGVGEAPARGRRGLEAAVAPARVEIEAL